jgi:hypothetical protein
MAGKSSGYGRSWKKWVTIYAVAGAVVYLLFFSDGGGGGGLY